MRQKILAGNWKLNGSKSFIESFFEAFDGQTSESRELVFIPPYPYLAYTAKHLKGKALVGAQDCSSHSNGAFTGEVAASMLADVGVRMVLVGHSERRSLFGDDDSTVAEKVMQGLEAGLKVCLCVGETQVEREQGKHEEVVVRQLQMGLKRVADSLDSNNLIIAYEPVWAIGTGLTASPDDAQAMHEVIRATLNDIKGSLGESTSLLYGGSVNASNADALFAQKDIDGGLVGGASLKPEEFIKIYKALG